MRWKSAAIVVLVGLGFLGCSLNDPPVIKSVSPAVGPTSGGTTVQIDGTGFTEHTRVGIDGREAHVVSSINSGALTVLTPAAPLSGLVDVVVRNRDGQKDTLKNGFNYGGASAVVAITSISPASGAAGTLVTLTGTGFQVGAKVAFGPSAGLNVVVLSSTSLQVGVPSGTGTVTVILTNPDGGTASTSFSYPSSGGAPPPGGGGTGTGKIITTFAGSATVGFSGDGGNATAALLANPGGVAVGTDGTVYIADTTNQRVRLVTIANIISTIVGDGTAGVLGDGGGGIAAQVSAPSGLAVDSSRNVYIADTGNHAVRFFAGATGTLTTIAGTLGTAGNAGDGGAGTAALLSGTNAVALDDQNNLYICDTGNHRVRLMSAGTIDAFAGSGTQGFLGDGGSALLAELSSPSGVVFEPSTKNVFISDTGNARVRFVDAAGTIHPYAGGGVGGDGGLATAALLVKPMGLGLTTGALFLADAGSHKVRSVATTNFLISTFAGTGVPGLSGDGATPGNAQLNGPAALAVNVLGVVWIADSGDGSVRVVR
ncbi:IPT/TIG domain-containing protein [bacterium]|nr:IPT/TIG domain-containing protein [bacterium]